MNTLKSAGAILAGMLLTFVLSLGTDALLSATGMLKLPFSDNSTMVVVLIIIYRSIYNIAGCYLAARLAPQHPMRHAMILGCIGLMLCIMGSIVMREAGVICYGISLIVLALPCSWIGGKLYRPSLKPKTD